MKSLQLTYPKDRVFLDKAIEAADRFGKRAVLLLVGSRAAGFSCSWSDLDLWILGDKKYLSPAERKIYSSRKELFVDRGDWEAHWAFRDIGDLAKTIETEWPDEKMWILATSRFLHGNRTTWERMKKRYEFYPHQVAEKKLKWLYGKYRTLYGPLNMAPRGKPAAALLVTGKVIECLCKICCVAEKKPFPYEKWLVDTARTTRLGTKVLPFIDRAVAGYHEFLALPQDLWVTFALFVITILGFHPILFGTLIALFFYSFNRIYNPR